MAELFPPQGQWTEDDYFALPDRNRHIELSDRELIMPPHPTFRHQEALKRLFLRLNAFVEAHDLGVVQLAPLPVRLGSRIFSLSPKGPGETAASGLLPGFQVKVDEVEGPS